MSRQERELDAAEYVVGTLSAVERTVFEQLIDQEKETMDDVLFWQRTFGALNASVSPTIPPEAMWERIEKALPNSDAETPKPQLLKSIGQTAAAVPSGANDNAVVNMKRSRGRWRMAAMAASLVAVGFGGLALNDRFNPQPLTQEQEFIAVVNADGDKPSLVVNMNMATGDITVRSIGVERPDGKSLELWYVPDGQGAVSVGLVGEGDIDMKDLSVKSGDLLAISVEPNGGSPTGQATGPIVYTGKLFKNAK